ncbi:MAG: hypothetical protein GX881_08690 [Firmicutes bacterium]|nr:hypothetical protein [Bacillota bacterium]
MFRKLSKAIRTWPGKFRALTTPKKIGIISAIVLTVLIAAPFIVKVASAGEVDIYAMVYELISRVDAQDEEIGELKVRMASLEEGEDAAQDPENGDGDDQPGSGGESTPPGGSGSDGDSGNGGSTPPAPPGGNGGNGAPPGNGDPPPAPAPEPWPKLAKVNYVLFPQRTDRGRMVYRFEGSVLYCDYYSAIPEKLYYGSMIYDQREEQTEYAFTESINLAAAWSAWENGGPKPRLKGRLPVNVLRQVSRSGGTLKVDLLNWIGRDAPHGVRYPSRKVHTIP